MVKSDQGERSGVSAPKQDMELANRICYLSSPCKKIIFLYPAMINHKPDNIPVDILVVDDIPDNLQILSSLLTEQGYKVRMAIDGNCALTSAKAQPPSIILLDIMMPDLNGYEICKQLKFNPVTREIPVIFLSALDNPCDKVKAFEMGGVDYITKPFHIQEVLARVEHQLTIQRQQHKITQQNLQLQQKNWQLQQEITARKQAEDQLQQLNNELKRSNSELEKFAYIASHDLQSPLQAILGNADLLSWKYQNCLGPDAERYIDNIIQAGERMKQLIQDLLAYSRVGTSTLKFEPIDCHMVLSEALSNLQQEIASSHASITHTGLCTVIGNKTQLIQLFQNLISNAIKFQRPEVQPQIKISAELIEKTRTSRKKVGNHEWLIKINDNGIGIEPQHFERIFEVFQRLHQADEYPGTGIGMAICKKIVERHRGRIWVESQIGVGTTFYFTLPK